MTTALPGCCSRCDAETLVRGGVCQQCAETDESDDAEGSE